MKYSEGCYGHDVVECTIQDARDEPCKFYDLKLP
jgi:hypothetical protein